MKVIRPVLGVLCLLCVEHVTSSVAGAEFDSVPANSELVVDESFDSALGKTWHINTGSWQTSQGVLRGKEVLADKHSAAARRTVVTQNAVYQMRFRFVDGGKAFHFGFDPAKGELDKKGHLFSVIVTPSGWKIMKHVDKNRRKEDPNEVLVTSDVPVRLGDWHELRVTTWGTHVTARLGDTELKTSHPTFGVKKPTLVFRCLGDGVEVDDVKVWRQLKP